MHRFFSISLFVLFLSFNQAYAADSELKSKTEYTAIGGTLLPNQFAAFDKITTVWGGRYGLRTADDYFYEAGLLYNELEDRGYLNVSLTLRGESPVSDMIAFYGLGGDITQTKGEASRIDPGAHMQGGLFIQIYHSLWFRLESKFSFSPGSSLFLGFGLTYRDAN